MDSSINNISNNYKYVGRPKIEERAVNKNNENGRRKKRRYRVGKWKQEEHEKFLSLFSIHGSNWPRVNKYH
jgi:hypothetical protein